MKSSSIQINPPVEKEEVYLLFGVFSSDVFYINPKYSCILSAYHQLLSTMAEAGQSGQSDESDIDLVRRAQRGDKRAFDLLVLKYQQKVAGVVSRYLRDQADIQDVVQEAFIKAYRALPKFRGDSAFYTWVYRIAINTAKNYLVSKSRRPPGSDVDAEVAEQLDVGECLQTRATPEDQLMMQEIESAVWEAINSLPDELRTAITLREIDGMSYEEISQAMDCPVGTVRSRIFRARETIDSVIQPLLH